MDFNPNTRMKQLDNLNQVIASCRSKIESILEFLDWKQEDVEKEDNLVQCPVNLHHRIHPKSWQEHIEKCVVKSEGYSLESQFLSEPPDDSKQSIFIDRNKKIELVTNEWYKGKLLRLGWNGFDPDPKTSDRLTSTFSPDERLIFYNHAVENTEGPPAPPEFKTLHKKSEKLRPITYQERVARIRDAKRRRIKYRSVRGKRKNHTEVMREVIDGQMKEYKDWLLAKNKRRNDRYDYIKDELERSHSSKSRYSSYPSSSRNAHRNDYKYRGRRDRSRQRDRSRSWEGHYRREDRHSKTSSGEERSYNKRRYEDERRRSRERNRNRHAYYDERRH